MNKKGSAAVSEIVVILAIVAIVGVLMLFIVTGKIGKGVNIASVTQSSTAVKSCIATWDRNNPDKDMSEFDLDNDNIIDVCDICTLSVKKKEFETNPALVNDMGKWFSDRDIKVEPTYELYKELFKNIESNDRDGDGIYDGCDSDATKPVVVWFGDVDRAIESECQKVEKQFKGIFHSKTRDSMGKYRICTITD